MAHPGHDGPGCRNLDGADPPGLPRRGRDGHTACAVARRSARLARLGPRPARNPAPLLADPARTRTEAGTARTPASRKLLVVHRAWQDAQRAAAEDLWEDHGFVFAQPNGRPIDARRDWLNWKALLAAAEVRDARLHDARHTAATLLLQQGVAARVAMQVLGHSHITLTLGTYSHVVPELAEDAAERMGRALWES